MTVSGVKNVYTDDDYLTVDVRLTSEYFKVVEVINSENIKNLMQIAIKNENIVPIGDYDDRIRPHANRRGAAAMNAENYTVNEIEFYIQ